MYTRTQGIIFLFAFLQKNISQFLFKDFHQSLHRNGKPKAAYED